MAAILLVSVEALGKGGGGWLTRVALGSPVGAIGGLMVGVVVASALRLRDRQAATALALVGIVGGLGCASLVGAFEHLADDKAGWGWAALLGGVVGGAASGLLLFVATRLRLRSPRARAAAAAGLTVASVALALAIPRLSFLVVYPAALHALQAAAWLAGAAAFVAVDPWPVAGRLARALSVAVFVAVVGLLFVPPVTSVATLSLAGSSGYGATSLALLRKLTDVDGDGWSAVLEGGDCAPWDPLVHPGAREIPDNGIDEDCSGSDGTRGGAPVVDPATVPIPAEPSPVSVVLITIDSLRADRTTPYGYERATTPELARFASDALQLERAYTTGGWTSLALASMFRGVYPRRLQWQLVGETNRFSLVTPDMVAALPPGEEIHTFFTLPTGPRRALPWWLSRRGMVTVAVVDDGPSEFLEPRLQLAGELDTYRLVQPGGDEQVADVAIDELAGLGEQPDPFFLWVHFYGPHFPVELHEDVPRFGDDAGDLYDHEVAHMDRHLGRVLGAIDELEQAPVVLITSDHGELIAPLARTHGVNLYEASVRIPMWLRGPGIEAGSVEVPASLVDVMPTILELTRTPGPPDLDGADLRELPADRVVISDLWRYDAAGERIIDMSSATDRTHRLIGDNIKRGVFLLDVTDDPQNPENLVTEVERPELTRVLRAYLDDHGIP